MTVELYVKCPVCDGKRRYPQLMMTKDEEFFDLPVMDSVEADCPTCEGKGVIPATPEQIVEAVMAIQPAHEVVKSAHAEFMRRLGKADGSELPDRLTPDELAAWIESCGDITKD